MFYLLEQSWGVQLEKKISIAIALEGRNVSVKASRKRFFKSNWP